MKTAIVSYSLTGNNTRYAAHLADALSAKHIQIKTERPVTYGTITLDMILHRKPKIELPADALAAYDFVLLTAPVWLGQVAFPMRRCLDALKKNGRAYGYLSVSGGADGNNPKLAAELEHRTGRRPAVVLDQHIRELFPTEPPPTREDTSNYQLSDADCERFTACAVEKLKNVLSERF
jgi:multimeric flavodoxin WrbA